MCGRFRSGGRPFLAFSLERREETLTRCVEYICTMTSFDCNYQNALRCNLCNADLCHARAILHKAKKLYSVPQSILGVVVK